MTVNNMVVLDDELPTLLQGETLKFLKLEEATSRVWDYFGFPAKNDKFLEPGKKKQKRVYCKLCTREFSYILMFGSI